ncbi:helix-turn-helix domain-containing protein [Rhodocyclaceae bacterium SMB388]
MKKRKPSNTKIAPWLERLMVAERTRGATFRTIASQFGLSKSHVHRLLRDVAIVVGPRAPKRPMLRTWCELVPREDGRLVAVVRVLPPRRGI